MTPAASCRALLVAATTALTAVAAADDRDLLAGPAAPPNVLLLVDTSTAMAGGVDPLDPASPTTTPAPMVPGAGDDPESGLGVAKRVLGELLRAVPEANFALAAFAQDARRAPTAHWVYEALDRDRFRMVESSFAYRCGANRDFQGRPLRYPNPAEIAADILIGYTPYHRQPATGARYGPFPEGPPDPRVPSDLLPIYFGQCVEPGRAPDGPEDDPCVESVFPVTGAATPDELWSYSFDRRCDPRDDPDDRHALVPSWDRADNHACDSSWRRPACPGCQGVVEHARRARLEIRRGYRPLAQDPTGEWVGNDLVDDLVDEDYDLDGDPSEPDLDGSDEVAPTDPLYGKDWVMLVDLVEERRHRTCESPGVGRGGGGCGPWSEWSRGWAAGPGHRGAVDTLRFKLLFRSALSDLRQGTSSEGRVDLDLLPPPPQPGCGSGYCNGWRLLVDLPPPPGGSDGDVARLLQPVAAAVIPRADGGFTAAAGFDPTDPAGALPLAAAGETPIAAALMDAFAWYRSARGPGGQWADDPLDPCRPWSVVLVTGSEESCARRPDGSPWPDLVCQPGQAAELFAAGGDGLAPVPVHVLDVRHGGDDPPAASCVAAATGGRFVRATDVDQVAAELRGLVTGAGGELRWWQPLTVVAGRPASSPSLGLLPAFRPLVGKGLWEGHLYAFALTPDQSGAPVDESGRVDVSRAAWDAGEELERALRGPDPVRNVFWSRLDGSAWARVDLATVPADPVLTRELGRLLRPPGGATADQVAEVVEFVRFVTPGSRPSGSPALGDIFHSAPAVVSPPGNAAYLANDVHDYARSFAWPNRLRRRVAVVGANDGLVHAFDAGFRGRDGTGGPDGFDLGTGRELFAVLPRAVTGRLWPVVRERQPNDLVDGTTTVADVHVPPQPGAVAEWRTVAITAMGRGGRGLLALDLTHPDPPGTSWSTGREAPLCLDGLVAGCSGEYPRVLWELEDPSDEDGNCPAGAAGEECSPYWDLGHTWSAPVVARVRWQDPVRPGQVADLFVAFFGGGWDPGGGGRSGNFLYGVDVASGEVVFKANLMAPVPGAPAVLDEDGDGFVERVYVGTASGDLYRLDVSAPAVLSGGRVASWALARLYDFPDDLRFFTRPVIVPALRQGGGFLWALALGTGDRSALAAEDGVANRFYLVLDPDDGVERGEASLTEVALDDPDHGGQLLDPAAGRLGWFLRLRPNEKVSADATVAAGKVLFPTFEPLAAGGGGGSGCGERGRGRLYSVSYRNADPVGGGGDGGGDLRGQDLGRGLIVGGTAYTIGDTTVAEYTTWEGTMEERPVALFREHVVTNWRQE